MQFPISKSIKGFSSFTDEEKLEAIKQNFKSLLLTRPEERVMTPNYGVGLQLWLFQMSMSPTKTPDKINTDSLVPQKAGILPPNQGKRHQVIPGQGSLTSKIQSQVQLWMPYINIQGIEIDDSKVDNNVLSVSIRFSVDKIIFNELITVSVSA